MTENTTRPREAVTSVTIRDAVFVLAHDEDKDFRLRLHPMTLRFALSAAVLCDLVLAEAVVVTEGFVEPTGTPRNGDPLSLRYYAVLAALPEPHSRPLREVIFRFAADVTARTENGLEQAGVLAARRDWLGRRRLTLSRGDLAMTARLPARNAMVGEYTAIGITLCTMVRALGLHEALLLFDRAQLEPMLGHVEQLMRVEAIPPLDSIPLIADALRGVIQERAAGLLA